MGLVSEQSLYNLNARTIELEVIPVCEELGLGLIPWSPLAGGLLGGVLAKAAAGPPAKGDPPKKIERFPPPNEQKEKFCKTPGEQPPDVAPCWVFAKTSVTAP